MLYNALLTQAYYCYIYSKLKTNSCANDNMASNVCELYRWWRVN